MILEAKKSAAVARVFKNLLKGSVLSQAHTFVQSLQYCVVHRKELIEESPKFLQNASVSNTQKVFKYFFSSEEAEKELDRLTFENVCSETLDSLSEYFEELVETVPNLKNADVVYSDGVLTVHLGKSHGTYVINRQTPNLQIWLSSPTSGPKRYNYVDGTWVYKHDKTTLHSLLDKEIKEIADHEVQFVKKCLHSKASV